MSWLGFSTMLVFLAMVFVMFFKWRYKYWYRRRVPYLVPKIPFGNIRSHFLGKEHRAILLKQQYDLMKLKKWRHAGKYFMLDPRYIPLDLDYVKNILTKDFHYFTDRGMYYNEQDDPLSANLLSLGGEKWRHLRTKLSPTFTSGKIKTMFHSLTECASFLLEKIESEGSGGNPVHIKEALACFTTNCIGSCAFGLECNTFKEENSPFRVYGQRIVRKTTSEMFKLVFALNFPKLAELIRLKTTPDDVTDFFMKMVGDTVRYREEHNSTRKDFIQLLIDLKNDDNTLSLEEMAAQCFVFFIGGFETASTTMSFVLYQLARHPQYQDKTRQEIYEVLAKFDDKITYEAIQELTYLDQVINETLRMYPPVPLNSRKCVKDYKVPDQDVVIEKGTTVIIPTIGIHYDQEYYPEPDKFDPERFAPEIKITRHKYAHIPFGEGPRMCIGVRFAWMQIKVGLVALLKSYNFTVNTKTQEPLRMEINSFMLSAEGGIWLNATKI